MTSDPTDPFSEHRGLLFTVAYEMLGSVADAEDVVQESWLRWAEVDHASVRDPRAYLVRTVTRQALNRMRTLRRRREEYVGPWLPEPLITAADVADDVVLADAVSFAMLVVLETLTPLERAVFVLREVFDFGYDEIALATDRSPAAVRQLASRARAHVSTRRPRVEDGADQRAGREEVAARFFAAAAGGDLQGLLDLLAPDVVLVSDGGGRVSAARRPVLGADKVARFVLGVCPDPALMEADWVTVNGSPGVVVRVGGRVETVMTGTVVDGRLAELWAIRNPDKLTGLSRRRVGRD